MLLFKVTGLPKLNSHHYLDLAMDTASSFNFLFSLIFLTFLRSVRAADTITQKQSLNDTETLVSANEIFELGFFSPGTSKNRFLGIWYKKTPGKVVWVANRDNPVSDSYGELIISNSGTFVIIQSTSIIWSSNISRVAKNPVLQLLNSGNIVLRDNSSTSYILQSFDYPSDTLLLDMKLTWNIGSGQERYLNSWKAPDDPSIANGHGEWNLVYSLPSGLCGHYGHGANGICRISNNPMFSGHFYEVEPKTFL